MSYNPSCATWSTSREIEYLESVFDRHGQILPEQDSTPTRRTFDGIQVLESWLVTCDNREWPAHFNLAAVKFTAQQLLTDLHRSAAA